MKLWANLTVVACLLALACVANAQTPPQPDTAALRSRFVAAFGKDFDLVKDELKPERSNAAAARTGSPL
jgi:hypothetical protein